jgi:hypothetical protein
MVRAIYHLSSKWHNSVYNAGPAKIRQYSLAKSFPCCLFNQLDNASRYISYTEVKYEKSSRYISLLSQRYGKTRVSISLAVTSDLIFGVKHHPPENTTDPPAGSISAWGVRTSVFKIFSLPSPLKRTASPPVYSAVS